MAKNKSVILLGYPDELVSVEYTSSIDYTVNKIGGKPNWPSSELLIPACPLCELPRPLLLQIYAPLDNSQFHRTFYLFACVNPLCSNQSKGWFCIRVQHLDKVYDRSTTITKKKNKSKANKSRSNWCEGADDWGYDNCDDECITNNQCQLQQPQVDDNLNEQNGNDVTFMCATTDNRIGSDDDDDSNSADDPIPSFGHLQVIDDKNANCGAQGGAAALINSSSASAEIEGEESEMVSVDAPITPERDLIAMLKKSRAIPTDVNALVLQSFFINVDEEQQQAYAANNILFDDHVRDLMQKYQNDEKKQKSSPSSPANATGGMVAVKSDGDEKYEKPLPAHGDLMFYNYLERVQMNPGQILRYSRDMLPLLIAPLSEPIPKCQYCGSELTCEIQVLSTLIPKLAFANGDATPIEFGNVMILTCVKNCWDTPDKMRLEHVIVQSEI